MSVVPGAIPVTTPDAVPTVPADGLLLLHVPPPEASARFVVPPTQTFKVPVMEEIGPTVTGCVT